MALDLQQPAEYLEYILSLDLSKCDIEVCLASGDPETSNYQFRRIHQSAKLKQKFGDAIDDALHKYREELHDNNIELRDFAAETDKPAQEIEYLNILPYDSIKKQIEPVEHHLDLREFQDTEQDFINKMRFYIMRIQPSGLPVNTPVYFYRSYSPSQMLSRSPFFAMWSQSGRYEDLTEPTFLFDRHVDCLSCDEHMFILQKSNFFKIFDIKELEKVALETLNRLEKKDLIYNFQRFKKDCLADKIKILKLKNISTKHYLDTLTIDVLHRTITKYTLPIQVDIVGGKKKLVYDPKERWAILHLLDDAYADSAMTKSSYYLKGKREIRKK